MSPSEEPPERDLEGEGERAGGPRVPGQAFRGTPPAAPRGQGGRDVPLMHSRASRREPPPQSVPPYLRPQRYGRYVALLAIVILALITINTIVTKPNGARGVAAGQAIPPFAAPLASGSLAGDVNVARHPDEGQAGKRPACTVRGAGILNVCELYERGPVVLAVFVQAGSCDAILSDMQALAPAFPGVSFAGVALKGQVGSLRKLISQRGLHDVRIGIDRSGVLAPMYKVASCPQTTLVLPGGRVQSAAILGNPSRAALRARVSALVAQARAYGWRQPSR